MLSIDQIRRHTDASSFERGRTYLRSGRVLYVHFEEPDTLVGEVQGSARQPYDVEIYLKDDGGIEASDCSCPLGGYCKHVVAVALKYTSTAANLGPATTPASEVPEWTRRLSMYLLPQPAPDVTAQPVVLAQLAPAGILSLYSSSRVIRSRLELQLRPGAYVGGSNKVSLSHLSWHKLVHAYGASNAASLGLSPLAYSWLRQLARELTLGTEGVTGNDRWIPVTDRSALGVRELLKRHAEAGVALVSGRAWRTPVTISADVIRLGIYAYDQAKGVALAPFLDWNPPAELAGREVVVAGSPPAIAAVSDGEGPEAKLHLYSAASDVPARLISDLQSKPVVIPDDGLVKFQTEILPKLAARFTVTSQSTKVKLPKTLDPVLQIEVDGAAPDQLFVKPQLVYGDFTSPLTDSAAFHLDQQGQPLNHNRAKAAGLISAYESAAAPYPELWENGAPKEVASLAGVEAAHFYTQLLPKLAALPDVQVQEGKHIPAFTYDPSEPEVHFNLDQSAQRDWFNLAVTVSVGGDEVALTDLLYALNEGQTHLLMASGRYIPLDHPAFDRLKTLIAEARSVHELEDGKLMLSRYQAGMWEELMALGIVDRQHQAWRTSMEGLLGARLHQDLPAPTALTSPLRDYQLTGFRWLAFLAAHKLGGVLADDMGLGKTIQVISLILWMKQQTPAPGPVLVIAPTSVVENWDQELLKFAPALSKVVMRSGNRSTKLKAAGRADVVITSYALLRRDFEQLSDVAWSLVVLDEAQAVKNHQSQAYAQIRKLAADHKIALTGTPLENNLMELWSIMSVVAPGLLPKPREFSNLFAKPIEQAADRVQLDRLRRRLKPFMMRRTKAAVAQELPPKTEQVLAVELEPAQRKLYDIQLARERQKVLGLLNDGGLQKNRFTVLKSITLLRQLCLHPGLVKAQPKAHISSKLELLRPQLEEIVTEGHQVLIFSQFTSFLAYARQMVEDMGLDYAYLDGQTKNRAAQIDYFRDGEAPVFLISLKAGGVGLNLTAADYCILLDPWWNPAVENQAIDRTHRIGQTSHVMVYRLIAKDTIEEKVLALQQSKRQLFTSVLEDGELFGTAITEDDIRQIFS